MNLLHKSLLFLIFCLCSIEYASAIYRAPSVKTPCRAPIMPRSPNLTKTRFSAQEKEKFETFKKLIHADEKSPQLKRKIHELFSQAAEKPHMLGSYINIVAKAPDRKEFARNFIDQNAKNLKIELRNLIISLQSEEHLGAGHFLEAIGIELSRQETPETLKEYAAMNPDIALGILQEISQSKPEKTDTTEKETLFKTIFTDTPKTNLFVSKTLNTLASNGKFGWINKDMLEVIDRYVHEAATISPVLIEAFNKYYAHADINDQLIILELLKKIVAIPDKGLNYRAKNFIANNVNQIAQKITRNEIASPADTEMIRILAYDKNLWADVLQKLAPQSLPDLIKAGLFAKHTKFIRYALLHGNKEQINALKKHLPASGAVASGLLQAKEYFKKTK